MNYIYDIVLNFNNNYYDFFEWKKNDKIINVKKIPVFKVSDGDIYSFKYNDVKVDKEFLNRICDLTTFYNRKSNYKYMCLLSNSNESIGVLFDDDGNLLKRSSMILDEEDEVNEEVCMNDITKFKYLKNIHKDISFVSRIDNDKRNYLLSYINKLDANLDSCLLKYIYYDYFELDESDSKKIKDVLLNSLINDEINMEKLYSLVRILKKISN